MTTVYLIRHGQAGSRDDYDRLSGLGREQSALLGGWLAKEGIQFDRAVIGGLRRQRETAEIVLEFLAAASLEPVRIETDERWNEFDLDAVFDGIAPLLAGDEPSFCADWEMVRRHQQDPSHSVNRQWTGADTMIVRSWIEGRYKTNVESWQEFNTRVLAAGDALSGHAPDEKIAVFTSATPVSIWVARTFLSTDASHIMKLAGAQLNTNLSLLEWRNGQPSLAGFNSVPHLAEKRLRTFR